MKKNSRPPKPRGAFVDPFDALAKLAPPYVTYQWKRCATLGTQGGAEGAHISLMDRDGWRRVPRARHPDFASEHARWIVFRGMILMEKGEEVPADLLEDLRFLRGLGAHAEMGIDLPSVVSLTCPDDSGPIIYTNRMGRYRLLQARGWLEFGVPHHYVVWAKTGEQTGGPANHLGQRIRITSAGVEVMRRMDRRPPLVEGVKRISPKDEED